MSWRTFKFFEQEEQKDPDVEGQPFDKLKDLGITCCACGRGQMIFGDAGGNLYILTNHFREIISFPAYNLRVHFIYQLRQKNIFITVGDDEELCPLIRVWNFDKRTKEGSPTLARVIRPVAGGRQLNNVMALTAHENMTMIAVGFKDGTVIVIRGNITRDRLSRQRILHEEKTPGVYITGLGFHQLGQHSFLMVSTTRAVYSYKLTDNDKRMKLDELGCELNCSAMTDHTQEHKFVIGRSEAVYFYTPIEKTKALAFEGEKFLLRWHRGYLIAVTYGGRVGGGRAMAMAGGKGGSGETMTLSIYDIKNQFVAYQATFSPRIIDVLNEWGCIYVLLKDGRLMRLEEHDTKTKLQTLFKKNLYPTAISLAQSQAYDDGLMDIFTQYGDHLYSKGDYDGAIAQYIRTIGKLEPSYVIRKFLDAQRIHNLTDYLKMLHKEGQANADHTTLLLNCYTKLREIDQLDEFVAEEQAAFDVETAIQVCFQANSKRHALALAKKYQKHDWYLRIQIEEKNYVDCLEYITRLPFDAADESMRRHGKLLMNRLPDETTSLLSSLCSAWVPKTAGTPPPMATALGGHNPNWSNPEHFITAFVNHRQHLMRFLERQIRFHPNLPQVVYNTLLELYVSDISKCPPDEKHIKEERALNLLKRSEASYNLDHALVLAQMHDFRAGTLYLYEKAGLFQQILLYHMEHNDYEQVMSTCKAHGRQDPNLWVQALSYFASWHDGSESLECKKKITEVLRHIEEHHLMPPLMVVQTLAESPFATLSDIKPYIVKHLQEENDQIAKDEQHIKQYREDTAKMRDQIRDLQTSAKIFQVMKCSLCKRSLSLPAVHFLCQHSFHQGCLDDDDNECPLCAKDNRKVLDFVQRQEQTTDLHEQFHAQLQRSADGFSVVAEYFGRGVFSKATAPSPGPGRRR